MVDQATQLAMLAAEMRDTISALAAAVPDVTDQQVAEDQASACYLGPDDDGTKAWNYIVNLRFTGDAEQVTARAEVMVQERGYTTRARSQVERGFSLTAVRDGAAITVNAGTDETGSAVVFLGYGACVAPDGTVNGVSPT